MRSRSGCRSLDGTGRAATWLAVPLLISGCAVVGPDFEPPVAPKSESWLGTDVASPSEAAAKKPSAEESEVETRSQPNAEWWTVFNDPVLDDLVQTAYQQNLSLRVAAVRIYEARAQLGIVIGDQYPQQQQLGGQYQHERISTNIGALRQINALVPINRNFDRWEVGFDAGWELDVWGQFRRGIEAADANLVAQIADYDDVLVSLTGEVASTYVTIRTLEERLAIARRNVVIQEEGLRLANILFRGGVATELDVDQATTLLNNTKAVIPQLEIGLQQATNALSVLLGMPPGELKNALAGSVRIPMPPPEVAVGLPADLIRRRPDIRAAELEAAAQSAQIGVAKADLYPSFTLAGSIGFQASDLTDLFSANSLASGIGPAVNWNFLSYGRIKNNVRVQDARLQELLVNYENTVLNAYLEVENALVAFMQTQQQAMFLTRSVAAAHRAVKIALLQYRDGTANYTRVLDTQTALLRGEDRLTTAKGSIVTNLVAVYKALGGGWQIREGRDFLPEATKEAMRERTDWGEILEPAALPKGDEALDAPPSPEPWTLFRRHPDW